MIIESPTTSRLDLLILYLFLSISISCSSLTESIPVTCDDKFLQLTIASRSCVNAIEILVSLGVCTMCCVKTVKHFTTYVTLTINVNLKTPLNLKCTIVYKLESVKKY